MRSNENYGTWGAWHLTATPLPVKVWVPPHEHGAGSSSAWVQVCCLWGKQEGTSVCCRSAYLSPTVRKAEGVLRHMVAG